MVVAVGTAAIAYKTGSKLTYSAFCTAEVFVRAPATNTPSPTPEFLTFTNSLAANLVSLATPTVYAQLAKGTHVPPGVVATSIGIAPAIGIGAFRVTITDSDASRTKTVAAKACSTFVSVITTLRQDELSSDIKNIQKRQNSTQADMKKTLAIPAARRSAAQTLTLATQQQILNYNALLIAGLHSTPPDNITVLTPASALVATHSTSLKKYLLIALVRALLVIFLFILVAEALSPQARDDASD